MTSPRTASVTLLLDTESGVSATGVSCEVGFDDMLDACPGAEDMLLGLRAAGWRLDSSSPESSAPSLLSVSFSKDFIGSTPIDACENARRCGVGDDLGPVFDWTPDCGSDDDGVWDQWKGEL